MGTTYIYAGELDAALIHLNRLLELDPGYISLHRWIGAAHMLKGELQTALENMRREPSECPRLTGLAMVYHELGQIDESEAALKRVIKQFESDRPFQIAYTMAFLERPNQAFEWLELARQRDAVFNDGIFRYILTEPFFENLHGDPRWLPFLESVGRSPDNMAAISFDLIVPD